MKYKVSTAAKPVAKKPFDFAAAYESLQQSLDKSIECYNTMIASEARVVEIEDCLRDGQQALASIKKYGVTPANMSIINADNNLDEAIGCEKLDMSALESLSESTAKALAANYIKGLEGLDMDNVKALLARIKEFFLKIIEWLKERFFSTAKLVKILKETNFEGEFDGTVQITALPFVQSDGLLDEVKTCADDLDTIKQDKELSAQAVDAMLTKEFDGKALEKKSGTVEELGYKADNVGTLKDKFLTVATSTVGRIDAAWKEIQTNYKKFESEAKGEDQGIKDKATAWFKALRAASKEMGQANKILQAIGMSILSVKKAFKAAAPAEPAK